MFNAQSQAVRIEMKLQECGWAKTGDADNIRKDPISFLGGVLPRFECTSDEVENASADFWDRWESYKGKRLDEFGEEQAREFTNELINLLK